MSRKTAVILLTFIFFTPLYFFRLKIKTAYPFQSGDRIKISGRLTQEPLVQDGKQSFSIKGIYIKMPVSIALHYNDYLEIEGEVYQKGQSGFLSINRFYLKNSQLKLADSGKGIVRFLFGFRQRLEKIFDRSLDEPHSSLLAGMVLGSRRRLEPDFYSRLKTSGTLHLIVASGMNISLLAGSLKEFLARFIKRKPALIIGSGAILVYYFIANMEPAISRAGLMAFILYLAEYLGRFSAGFWALLVCAMLLLVLNPLLLFDIGFQLSFMATAGLIIFGSEWQRKLRLRIFCFRLPAETGETLAAMVLTMPILIINFGSFNPLVLAPNLLVLWLVPHLMVLGLLIIFSGLFFWPLARFFSLLAYLPLTYFIKVIDLFGRLEIFSLKLENFSFIAAIGYYLLLFVLINRKKRLNG